MAVVTGLQAPSHLYIEQKDIMPCSSITDELKKAGYETYMFSIGNVSDGNLISIVKAMPFDHFWGYSSDNPKPGYKVWRWGYEEEDAVKEVLEQLEAKKSDVPYFIWYRGMCPHAPFPPLGEQAENPFKQTGPSKKDKSMCLYGKRKGVNKKHFLKIVIDTRQQGLGKIVTIYPTKKIK